MAEPTDQLVIDSFTKIGGGATLYDVKTNQGDFYYFPSEFITKGYLSSNGFMYFDPDFLKQDVMKLGQGINLDPSVIKGTPLETTISLGTYENPLSGVLFPKAEFDKVASPSTQQYYDPKDRPKIAGMTTIDGQNVYLLEGYTDRNYQTWDSTGGGFDVTITPGKSKFGKLGEIASGIAKTFAGIPLLPEIAAAVIPGAGPALYGSLKALQTAGKGGDLGDVVKSGVTGGATFAAGQAILGGAQGATPPATPPSVGGTPGVSEVFPVDMSVGGSVTPIPPMEIGLPGYGLLDGVTFPGQGLKAPPSDFVGSLPPSLSDLPPGVDGILGGGLTPPTMPTIPGMGGVGLTVQVPGGTVGGGGFVPSDAVPVLGDPSSFINDPDVLGRPVINSAAGTISLRDALDAARGINRVSGLLGGGGGSQPVGGGSDPGQMPSGSVDVSNLLALLSGAKVRTPNVYSLLG
jgi:hypothetical protein